MLSNRSTPFLISLLVLLTVFSADSQAEELRNDGWENGGNLAFQGGFATGEIGAVRLVPTIAGSWPLQNVQLMFGGSSAAQSIILTIWDDSAGTNSPGALLFTEAYMLTGSADFLSEIDLSGEGISVSGAIRVGIEFTHTGYPSIARDGDGNINASRNFIKSGGVWYQSNLFGLTGDWIIRANTGQASVFTVGGQVSGLNGSLTLQNNGSDDLVINSNGPFTFLTALNDGDAYNVTVLAEPVGQSCVVSQGAGTISGVSVSDVQVVCSGGSSSFYLSNDSFVDGGEASFQGGFVTSEIAASRFSTPAAGEWSLDNIELLFGDVQSVQFVTLKIWEDNGASSIPGTEIYSEDFGLMGGEFLQQLDLSGAGLSVEGNFRVGLQFQHDGFPSVARDMDGITPDRNFIYDSAGQWYETSQLGVQGDWIIRATVSQTQELVPFEITSVSDFPNDQGRQVRITWPGNQFDAAGSSTPVTGYAIFRRIDPDLKSYPPGDWDYLLDIPAFQEDSYSTIVPTAADSTINDGMYYSVFFVRAMTASPGTFYDSAPDSGYSVDNLAPGAPASVTAEYQSDGVTLDWADAPEEDFQYFAIFRGLEMDFETGPGTLVHQTSDSYWVDDFPDPWSQYYKIITVDYSGNESADSAPMWASGNAGNELPLQTRLLAAVPNPFNPSTLISFELSAAGQVRLDIYDVMGRKVKSLIDEALGSGNHQVRWDGLDDSGRAVSAGVYLYHFEMGDQRATRRVVLVK